MKAIAEITLPSHEARNGKIFISGYDLAAMGEARASMLLAEVRRRGLSASYDQDRGEWCIFDGGVQ